MKAGLLTTRVELRAPLATRDAIGQPTQGWHLVYSAWANVRHISGSESIKAERELSKVRAAIRIRFWPDANATMRVHASGAVYEIKAVMHDGATRRFTDLVCEKLD